MTEMLISGTKPNHLQTAAHSQFLNMVLKVPLCARTNAAQNCPCIVLCLTACMHA